MELIYHNLTSFWFEYRAKLNLLAWKLCHKMPTYALIFAEIFRIVATTEVEIHIILYLKTESPGKSLQYDTANCPL